jgi:hypothetical protein
LLWRVGVGPAVAACSNAHTASLAREGHVYEVGVFTGNSMLHLASQLRPPMIWGFDSFEGLPESTEEHVSEWHAGKVKPFRDKRDTTLHFTLHFTLYTSDNTSHFTF